MNRTTTAGRACHHSRSPARRTDWIGWVCLGRRGASDRDRVEWRTCRAGGYRIRADAEQLLYIGQSGELVARLRSHARLADWPGPVSYSLATMPAGYTSTQLLEVENDLIAGYFAHTGHAPTMQFGQEAAPAD